jgi:hypothetical protein
MFTMVAESGEWQRADHFQLKLGMRSSNGQPFLPGTVYQQILFVSG